MILNRRRNNNHNNQAAAKFHRPGRAIVKMGLLAAALTLGGCASDAQNGALLGGALGAGAGAIIGHNSSSGKGWAGAGIGAAAGALGGYLVGNEIDKDKSRKQNPNDYSRYDY